MVQRLGIHTVHRLDNRQAGRSGAGLPVHIQGCRTTRAKGSQRRSRRAPEQPPGGGGLACPCSCLFCKTFFFQIVTQHVFSSEHLHFWVTLTSVLIPQEVLTRAITTRKQEGPPRNYNSPQLVLDHSRYDVQGPVRTQRRKH
jgi:hypothetical protein